MKISMLEPVKLFIPKENQMSGNDTRKLSETFAKPAEYKGSLEEYDNVVSELADAFRYSNPHADRGFHQGGLYYPVRADHVKRAVQLKYGC